MKQETYNGWTNYATWRINLEIFDGFDYTSNMGDVDESNDPLYLAAAIKDYAEEIVSIDIDSNSLALSYALAFMSEVNWYEIAEHLIEGYKEELAYNERGAVV
jgi:hypothetical protein